MFPGSANLLIGAAKRQSGDWRSREACNANYCFSFDSFKPRATSAKQFLSSKPEETDFIPSDP
jgi:hypothetical protein